MIYKLPDKEKQKQAQHLWYVKNKYDILRQRAIYRTTPQGIASKRKYLESEKGRLTNNEGIRRWKKNNRYKVNAEWLAQKYIKITNDTICEICKVNKAIHRHHPDYNFPLEVILVCRKCHTNLHNQR